MRPSFEKGFIQHYEHLSQSPSTHFLSYAEVTWINFQVRTRQMSEKTAQDIEKSISTSRDHVRKQTEEITKLIKDFAQSNKTNDFFTDPIVQRYLIDNPVHAEFILDKKDEINAYIQLKKTPAQNSKEFAKNIRKAELLFNQIYIDYENYMMEEIWQQNALFLGINHYYSHAETVARMNVSSLL